jgi:hypothetical protein
MAYVVSTEDIETRWRPLSDAERVVATALLADATAMVDAKRPLLASQVAAGDIPASVVEAVLVQMVLRVLKNPDGKRQESIDDYAWTRDNAVASGQLYVTAEELDLLSVSGSSASGFTITPSSGGPWVRL